MPWAAATKSFASATGAPRIASSASASICQGKFVTATRRPSIGPATPRHAPATLARASSRNARTRSANSAKSRSA